MEANLRSDDAIVQAIQRVLGRRAPGASACPSEVARSLSADQWRPLMPAVRRVAATLARQGALVITQRGVVVDPQQVLDGNVRGPLRLRLREE
jgi:hypothetical protein